MSHADTMFNSLLGKCAVPSVADTFLKGFKGAGGYRDRYRTEYNTKCVNNGVAQPPTTVFTPEVVNQVEQDQQQLQSGGLQNPNANPNTYYNTQTGAGANPPPSNPPPSGNNPIACNRVTNSEWFCDFKFPSAQKRGNDTTESSLQACQNRCFEDTGCGGWSIRQKDGVCRLYTTSGSWPYKDQMVSAGGWVGGPRWDTKQGLPDTSTPTDTNNNDTTTAAPVETTTPAPTGLQKLWRDNKTIIIIASVFLVVMILGSSFSAILLVMS
jgi:hypothetical protein